MTIHGGARITATGTLGPAGLAVFETGHGPVELEAGPSDAMPFAVSTDPGNTMNHALKPAPPGAVRALGITVLAVVADLLIFWAASAVDATWEIDAPYDISAPIIVFGTAVPLLVGAAVLAVLARVKPALIRAAAWAGIGFALISAAMPFAVSTDTPTSLALAAMHLAVGAAWAALALPATRT